MLVWEIVSEERHTWVLKENGEKTRADRRQRREERRKQKEKEMEGDEGLV